MEITEGKSAGIRETRLILVGFLLSGAAALIYEVTWTRALSLVLGSTVYALSTMLSTFMTGLALGAFICGRHCDRNINLLFALGLCELGIGISGLISMPLIYGLPSLYLNVYRSFHDYPTVFFIFQVLMCVLVMLVPTTLMGATFPIVSKRITQSMDELGTKVSRAYSFNTLGAVGGSLAAGFLLIPSLGLEGSAMVAAGLNALVGFAMLMVSGGRVLRPLMIAIPILVMSAVLVESSSPQSYLVNFHTARRIADDIEFNTVARAERARYRQIFHEEHPEGQVRAYRSHRGELLIQVGGKPEGTGVGDRPNMLLAAYLPIASHAEASGSFLNIGLGAGVTLAAAKKAMGDVELVEVNPGVIRAVSEHGTPGLLDGVTVERNDARNFLMRTQKKYDIISSEPSYPTESGVANLYTREFYELAASRLNEHGVYCQWLPYYLMRDEDVTMMAKTFGLVFPYAYLWMTNESGDIIMVGSRDEFHFKEGEIRWRVRGLNATLSPIEYSLYMTPADIRSIVADRSVPVNTDNRPILEFRVVRNIIAGSSQGR